MFCIGFYAPTVVKISVTLEVTSSSKEIVTILINTQIRLWSSFACVGLDLYKHLVHTQYAS